MISDILEILLEILKNASFKVYPAADGKAAYAMVSKHMDAVLLITDIVMLEIEGIELIQKTWLARPDLKIIAVSGGGIGDKSTYLALAKRLGANDCIE
jgi:DNA-binding NtrC family response regulator